MSESLTHSLTHVSSLTRFLLQSCVKLYTDSGEKVWEDCCKMGKGLEGPNSHDRGAGNSASRWQLLSSERKRQGNAARALEGNAARALEGTGLEECSSFHKISHLSDSSKERVGAAGQRGSGAAGQRGHLQQTAERGVRAAMALIDHIPGVPQPGAGVVPLSPRAGRDSTVRCGQLDARTLADLQGRSGVSFTS